MHADADIIRLYLNCIFLQTKGIITWLLTARVICAAEKNVPSESQVESEVPDVDSDCKFYMNRLICLTCIMYVQL